MPDGDEPYRENASAAPHEEASTDHALIRRIRLGDEAAFDALVQQYARVLYRVIYDVVLTKGVAEELLQDVFLTLWERRTTWEVRGQLRSYLYRAARNRALNHVKRERIERRWYHWSLHRSPAPATAPAAEQHVFRDDFARALACAVDRLPARAKEAYRLRWQHDLTNPEIAEVMGISLRAVERLMHRALIELRRALADFAS